MKKSSLVLLLSCIAFGIGCKKDADPLPDPNVNFSAVLNGASSVPANASTATGNATAVFNSDTKKLVVTVTYTGMVATAGNIHRGAPGVNGVPVFPFSSVVSPISYYSTGLPPDKEADLLAGLYYISLRSSTYPFGEIRGQLLKN
jgi:hypothetical protein